MAARLRLLLALLTLALLAAPAAASAKRKAPVRCNGEARLCDRRLDKVVFPATHNSMSARSLGWLIPNQPFAIPRQLGDGVRGFLFDTHYGSLRSDGKVHNDDTKTPQSKVYLCHELCQLGAEPLVTVLRQVKRFLVKHPRTVLVFDQEDYVTPQDFGREMVKAGLNHYVYRGRTHKPWPKLRTMIRSHQQIVSLAEHDATGLPWQHLDYAGIVQETPYTFKTPNLLTDPANWYASCAPNRGGTTGSLFLMNHWSPDIPPSQPDPATANRVNAYKTLVGRSKACHKRRGRWPNLVAVDNYRNGGLFAAVRKLNSLIVR